MSSEIRTLGDLRRVMSALIAGEFERRGFEGTAALDARLLLAHLLSIEPESLLLRSDEAVTPEVAAEAMALARRRGNGEPVARITGRKGFWSFDLMVGPDTLIPRPDTETLVEACLAVAAATGREAPFRILDIGTGSGAILLSLLAELPGASGVGTDLSSGALAIAQKNAEALGLARRVHFQKDNWAQTTNETFDFVVSNPPYIESSVIPDLSVDVRDFDPLLALDGGTDGLDAYRAIIPDLPRLLSRKGSAFLEIGIGQGQPVRELAAHCGMESRFYRDLAGIDRVVEIKRSERTAATPETA